jgi:hypothetical protein
MIHIKNYSLGTYNYHSLTLLNLVAFYYHSASEIETRSQEDTTSCNEMGHLSKVCHKPKITVLYFVSRVL